MRVVDSRNRVSLGGILWKTTLAMDDLPLLESRQYLAYPKWVQVRPASESNLPAKSHQEETRFRISRFDTGLQNRSGLGRDGSIGGSL
jgi:hypothetical protein